MWCCCMSLLSVIIIDYSCNNGVTSDPPSYEFPLLTSKTLIVRREFCVKPIIYTLQLNNITSYYLNK
jgi:hypothetical protein